MAVLETQTRATEFRTMLGERVLLADGAMGTMLYAQRPFANRSLDELNLSLPALVRDVHREYLRAGADILKTNTFGAIRPRLESFGFAEKVRQINHAGVRIAREAARDQAFVAGVVGPLGIPLEPFSRTSKEKARAYFLEQIGALLEAGVDLLTLETFRDCSELEEAILAAREAAGPELVVAAQVSVEDDGFLADGSGLEAVACRLEEWPVDVVGINCSAGPRVVFEAIEKMAAFISKPLSAMPGLGLPGSVAAPGYLAQYARRFVRAGVTIIGGCCGSTPEHIRAVRDELRSLHAEPVPHRPRRDCAGRVEPAFPASIALSGRGRLGARLASGQFTTLVETVTSRGVDAAAVIEQAKRLKAAGVDSLVVTDRPDSGLSSSIVCQLVQQHAGMETALRLKKGVGERGIARLQSELLDAHALGARNILCGQPDAAAVARMVDSLNQGRDAAGNSLGSQTSFTLGVECGTDSHDSFDAGALAGVDYLVLDPVFDGDGLDDLLERAARHDLPVVAGLPILTGARDAEYLINEQRSPVPAAYVARLSAAADSAAEGLAIAREIAASLRPGTRFAGILLHVFGSDPDVLLKAAQALAQE